MNTMSDLLYGALEECLQAMDNGSSIQQCLAMYPELEHELRPALEAALAARSLAEVNVPVEAMNRSRTRLLGKAAMMRNEKTPKMVWMGFSRLVFSLVFALVLFVVTSSGLLAVSAKSLPGDKLYPVKKVVEDLRVQLAPSGVQKYEAVTEYRQQRIDEVQELLNRSEQRSISYEGVVEEITDSSWVVGGVKVIPTADTKLVGDISVGMLVEVNGVTDVDGYVTAKEIHLREYQFSGVVESIVNKEWVINGMRLKVVPETQIGTNIKVGSVVLVLARSDDDATWKAMAILGLSAPSNTPTPVDDDKGKNGTSDPESETETQAPEDDPGSHDEQSTPEPKKTDDDSGSDDEQSTSEPRKTDDDSESGDDKSTPKPKDKGGGSGNEDQTPEPEETDDQSGGSTEEPEETQEPEVTPTPGP